MYQDLNSKTKGLLAESHHSSLDVERIRKLLCEVYKIVSNISPNIVSGIFQLKKSRYTVKPEKNTTIKFHKNALKQFSRRLKFTNLASEPQKNSNQPFYECIIQVIHRDNFMGAAMFASKSISRVWDIPNK